MYVSSAKPGAMPWRAGDDVGEWRADVAVSMCELVLWLQADALLGAVGVKPSSRQGDHEWAVKRRG